MEVYTQEDLAGAIAVLSDADLEDGEIDQVDEIVICFAKEKMQIEAIMDAEAQGQMNEQEADAAIVDVVTEHAQKRLDVFDLEIDLGEFSQVPNNEAISFSQATGQTIANLIDSEYPSSQAGRLAIAGATGLSLDDINRVILGESVPNTEAATAIAACFSATQTDEGFKEFMNLSSRAMGEAAEFSTPSQQPSAEFLQTRAQNNELQAQFSALQLKEELGRTLRVLEKQGDRLVLNGSLTPFEKSKLFGEGSDKEEALALFSAACIANNVPIETQIDRVRYYLSVAEQRGQVIQFSEPKHLSSEIKVLDDDLGQENAQDYFDRNGYT